MIISAILASIPCGNVSIYKDFEGLQTVTLLERILYTRAGPVISGRSSSLQFSTLLVREAQASRSMGAPHKPLGIIFCRESP